MGQKWIYLEFSPKTCPWMELGKTSFSKMNPFFMLENPLMGKNDPIKEDLMKNHQINLSQSSKSGS